VDKKTLKTDFLLILTALIWGFAFTAQRTSMRYIGPFLFNGLRFFLGAFFLIPVLYFLNRKNAHRKKRKKNEKIWLYGLTAGIFLFAGASLQQIGIIYTTAGKSGFITGLYVVLVPILGMFFGQQTEKGRWIGVVFAAAGLYFLSITESFTIEFGDFLVFLSAFFWAAHVIAISKFSPKVDALKLSMIQYFYCAAASIIVAVFTEKIQAEMIQAAWLPIFYGGVCSVGIAYTLQVVAQKDAHPAHAAIILSMEGTFAVLGGFLILGEVLTPRNVLGCALMFCGMLISQGSVIFSRRKHKAVHYKEV